MDGIGEEDLLAWEQTMQEKNESTVAEDRKCAQLRVDA